jgi:hypothetical protein
VRVASVTTSRASLRWRGAGATADRYVCGGVGPVPARGGRSMPMRTSLPRCSLIMASNGAVDELHAAVLVSLLPAAGREPRRGDEDAVTGLLLLYRTGQLPDMADADDLRIALGLNDAEGLLRI